MRKNLYWRRKPSEQYCLIAQRKSSTTAKVKSVSKSSTKQRKPMERKEQNAESVSTSKQRNDQSFWLMLRWNI